MKNLGLGIFQSVRWLEAMAGATYPASGDIDSQSKVINGRQVTFSAGNSVLLQGGFEVENGGVFTVVMEGCP